MLATLGRGVDNGESKVNVVRYARQFGQVAQKDTTAPNKLDPVRTAIRYYKFAASMQASDTTSLQIGSASVALAQRIAAEPRTVKKCDLAKEMAGAMVDAQVELPKAGRAYPDVVARLMGVVAQLSPYSDQLTKAVCREIR